MFTDRARNDCTVRVDLFRVCFPRKMPKNDVAAPRRFEMLPSNRSDGT